MDATLFLQMLQDKDLHNLKKMQYCYSKEAVAEFLALLKQGSFSELPLRDFQGNSLVYLPNTARVDIRTVKLLLRPQQTNQAFRLKAMEREICDSLAIENISVSPDSIRRILNGNEPTNEEERQIRGMKQGLDFIADPRHTITEDNLHALYRMTGGNFLPPEERLLPGKLYRHDSVCVVGGKVEHQGLPHAKLPEYMRELLAFANQDDDGDELVKASILHFYFAYLHPYFDGNGRTARLLHLWYLVQRGYPSALFVPFSSYIKGSKKQYYQAYSTIEENAAISGLLDVTPFVDYFIDRIYNRIVGENLQ